MYTQLLQARIVGARARRGRALIARRGAARWRRSCSSARPRKRRAHTWPARAKHSPNELQGDGEIEIQKPAAAGSRGSLLGFIFELKT